MMVKRRIASRTKSPHSLFGPPPIIDGEDSTAYDELLSRISDAVAPTDFIEEIWVRDLADVTWTLLIRLRRVQAAFLEAEIYDDVNEAASSIAEADPKLIEGTKEQKQEMERLLGSESELSWAALIEQNPRANEKYQNFWDAAESTLDKDAIQAKVMVHNLDTIERIENLIRVAQQRIDAIIREMDRHRLMRKHYDSAQVIEEADFRTINPKMVAPKLTNKKVV